MGTSSWAHYNMRDSVISWVRCAAASQGSQYKYSGGHQQWHNLSSFFSMPPSDQAALRRHGYSPDQVATITVTSAQL